MKKFVTIVASTAILGLVIASTASANDGRDNRKININSAISASATTSGSSTVVKARHISLLGKVTAISGNTLTVSGRDKSWTVNVTGSTTLYGLGMAKATLGQTQVGDKILIKGDISSNASTTINAKSIQNLSLHVFKVTLKGIVSNLNAAARSFTLTLANNKTINVVLTPDAKFKFEANGSSTASSSFANIQNGSVVLVSGILDRNNSSTLSGTMVKGMVSTTLKIQDDDLKLNADEKHEISESIKEGKMSIQSFLKSLFR